MSQWIYRGIESKAQLKSHRIDKWRGECISRSLFADNQYAWTEDEKTSAAEAWAIADADYEQRKTALLEQLAALSADDLADYFNGIGVDLVEPAEWLSPSPV